MIVTIQILTLICLLFAAFIAGGLIGLLLAALCAAGRDEEDYDEEL